MSAKTDGLVIGADGFALPLAALTQRIVVLGQSGSGKSNTVTDLVEEVLERGLQTIIVDYKGDFWGLQSSADGKRAGYDIVTFGGDHPDVELHEDAGRTVADVIVGEGFSAILDLSNFESRESMRRFITAFAKRLFFLKKDKPTPVLLVLDEVDQYAAQKPIHGEQTMLGAIETLVRLGRKRGIGVTMTTQAPAIVSKNVLEQGDLYIFHQIAGKNAVKAIEDAIRRNATEEELRSISRNIGRLQVGEAFVYSPAWLRILQAVKMRRRRTFDSGRTPQVGDTLLVPTARAKPDIPALRAQIEATIERAKAEDPKVLRAEIARLKGELAKRPTEKTVETATERVEVPVIDAILAANLAQHFRETYDSLEKMGEALVSIRADVARSGTLYERLVAATARFCDAANRGALARPVAPARAQRRGALAVREPAPRAPRGENATACDINGKGPQAILAALASKADGRATRAQLAFLSGYGVAGGSYARYLSTLRLYDAITDDGGRIAITAAGRALLRTAAVAPATTEDVLAMFRAKLAGGPRKLFDALIKAWPGGLSRSELGDESGYEASGGSFARYLSSLSSAQLIERNGGVIRLVDELFPTGAV